MARATRIALDLALVSVTKLRPTIGKLWGATKSVVVNTKARPLVSNIVVSKLETALDKFGGLVETAITSLRDKQLPREEKYLERELASSKALRPVLGTAWQYAKVEMVPPLTLAFFNGAPGKKLENTVARSVDGFISGLDRKIRDLDEAELRAKREKEAAIKAAQEKVKEEAKAKELARKKEAEEKRKAAEKEAKAKADAKAAEEAKKEKPKEAPKPTKTATPKKKPGGK